MDDDEGLEEDDEVIGADENLELEEGDPKDEEDDIDDDQQTVCTGMTGSNTNV
eukprot:CAMPEP_0170559582 /NCGR_PEP_ID=MMETSP0211-20121228/43703_1 /TAXON_ID=311385 /ORGANISM="Pseudokeronopsis sp., Strain OXSARD2" /LENGTH=52 /DNA_ID=CAMNT_0010872769 /DNA_START=742 /DNA_END=900 /DNA_ORIENTATION=-